ncbi:unnamed protein product [Nippostrongylus brasiliensis]|uniref:Uncharacterized protein n=1 Tax=Nippostrongylus brasiliensis TaxID=27835 RepID=A0A158QZ25_NIPBR|nr:unnamed protein product [Nippostrongylus brasiliensis]
MDSRRNWILLEASTSSSATPIQIRENRRRLTPMMEKYSEEERLHTINRLNDRIHKRIMNNYRSDSVGEGTAVVDESFRFIDDEQKTIKPEPTANGVERLDSFISHRNSHGEVEAVYERRMPSTSSRNDILRSQSLMYRPQIYEESIYGKPNRSFRTISVTESPQMKHSMENRREAREIKYRRTDSDMASMRYGRSEMQETYKRSDSLDSGSLRLQRQRRYSRWPAYSRPYMHYDRVRYGFDRRREATKEEPFSGYLYRPAQFYDKCDLCVFQNLRFGEYCLTCGRTGGIDVSSPIQPSEPLPYRAPQILDVRDLSLQKSKDIVRLEQPPLKVFSTEFRELRPPTRGLSRRQTKSAVYRYGELVIMSKSD